MILKVGFALMAQIFILLPAFARQPPHFSLTEQQIRDATPKNTFGKVIALDDLRSYLWNSIFDQVPHCYETVKQEYKKLTEEFTENLKNTFCEIKKIFGKKFQTILNGAQPSVNYLLKRVKEYPDELEKHIKDKDSDALLRLIGDNVFGFNYYDFEFDISMQKFLQQIHQDSRVARHDKLVLNVRNQAMEKSKEVMKNLTNCLKPFLDYDSY